MHFYGEIKASTLIILNSIDIYIYSLDVMYIFLPEIEDMVRRNYMHNYV